MPEFVLESQIPSSYSSQTAEQLFEKMHPPASLPLLRMPQKSIKWAECSRTEQT